MSNLSLLNGIIYNSLKNSDDKYIKIINGIYTYLPKNPIFPYIFIEYINIKQFDTFESNIYKFELNLKIYDKCTSSTNILNITDSVKDLLKNITAENILDIRIYDIKNNFNNNLFPYFESIINTVFLVHE